MLKSQDSYTSVLKELSAAKTTESNKMMNMKAALQLLNKNEKYY